MHELSICNAIVAAAERHADGRPVRVVRVRVGALRQVVPDSLGFYFEIAAMESLCAGAALESEPVSALLRCGACRAVWDPAPPPAPDETALIVGFRCPSCGGSDHRVMSGDELLVESIDVVEGAPAPADVGGS